MEHMRHRHRVQELEAELVKVRAHLDQLLEMPDHGAPSLPAKHVEALPEPAVSNGAAESERKATARKRVSLTTADAGRDAAGSNGRSEAQHTQAPVQEPSSVGG